MCLEPTCLSEYPSLVRQMWRTLIPLIPRAKSQRAVSGIFSNPVITSPPTRPEVLEANTYGYNLCTHGVFHFLEFQTSCCHVTSPIFVHVLHTWILPSLPHVLVDLSSGYLDWLQILLLSLPATTWIALGPHSLAIGQVYWSFLTSSYSLTTSADTSSEAEVSG